MELKSDSGPREIRPDEVMWPARRGRATAAQKRGLREFLPRYEVAACEAAVDWAEIFGRSAPLVAEFGAGHGEALAEWAAAHPEWNHVGFEVYPPGVGALAAALAARGLANVRIVRADAGRYAARMIGEDALAEARIFFPDPWPKKRHWKRALVNADFAAALSSRIRPGGILHLATDDEACAARMAKVLSSFPEFVLVPDAGRRGRPQTRFERRALRSGRKVWETAYRRA